MRSGAYVRQLDNYKAFIPNELPPAPLKLDWEMQELLSKADRALGRLKKLGQSFKCAKGTGNQ